jgi:ankyrin repeat protein
MTKVLAVERFWRGRSNSLRTNSLSYFGVRLNLLFLAFLSPSHAEEMLTDLVAKGDLRGVKVALDKGAPVNLANTYGETALFLAVNRGQIELVRVLLQQGADADLANGYGMSPLALASMRGYEQIVVELIAYEALVSPTHDPETAPLYNAVLLNRKE